MRITFRATKAEFAEDEYVLICGVFGYDPEGAEHYLSFDRLSEGAAESQPEEEWGIRTEFDDQINSAYNCIGACRLCRTRFEVDLAKPLGRPTDVEGFDITLDVSEQVYQHFKAGLRRVFRGPFQNLLVSD